jgi:hypothetical protein
VPAHRDEAVATEQRRLERAFSFGGRGVRDAGQFVDQRHDGADRPPAIQVGGDDDAGERVHDQDVEAGRVESASESRRGFGLLRRARTTGHHLLHRYPIFS